MTKTELLDKTAQTSEERQLLAHVLDKLAVAERGAPSHTGFLSQGEQEAVTRLLNADGHPRHLFAGGYEGAERRVCAFLPDWQEEDGFEPPYTALRCQYQPGSGLTHRDFLGSILGQGLDREKVGDILVRDGACDLLVFQDIAPYLLSNLDGAGRVKFKIKEIPLEELEAPELEVKLVKDTVSSLRLDAVLATGFSMGRAKAAGLITSGKVEVNHRPCVKADKLVTQGDVLTGRGLGKCVVKEVNGLSKKGRTMIVMERYL